MMRPPFLLTVIITNIILPSLVASLPTATRPGPIELPLNYDIASHEQSLSKRCPGASRWHRKKTATTHLSYQASDYYPTVVIGVGMPPQPFKLLFDTGSADTWVPTATPGKPRKFSEPAYNKKFSLSYSTVPANVRDFNSSYASGTSVSGSYFRDSLTVGWAHVRKQLLAGVPYENISWSYDVDFDGVLGAAFPGGGFSYYYYGTQNPTLPIALYEDKQVSDPLFSVRIGALGGHDGSVIFGGTHKNTTAFKKAQVYGIEEENGDLTYTGYYVYLNGVSAGSKKYNTENFYLVDTGSTFTSFPDDTGEEIGRQYFGDDVEYNQDDQLYHVKHCLAHQRKAATNTEIVALNIDDFNGQTFNLELSVSDLLLPLKSKKDECVLIFAKNEYYITIGNSLMQRFITVFNFGEKSVSFSRIQ